MRDTNTLLNWANQRILKMKNDLEVKDLMNEIHGKGLRHTTQNIYIVLKCFSFRNHHLWASCVRESQFWFLFPA